MAQLRGLIILGMIVLLCGLVSASVSLTTPAASAELLRGSSYAFTAANTTQMDNCTFAYVHRGETSWTDLGTNASAVLGSIPLLRDNIPDDFGTFTFRVNCTNLSNSVFGDESLSVSVHAYGKDEATEVSTDIMVGILESFNNISEIITIILLLIWVILWSGLGKKFGMKKKP